ncbi:MAG: DNA recombination protein RmuC [Proteobacteria bacterium]|nr:DNA recombination protein RmuC [Burkholderiales bacterium]
MIEVLLALLALFALAAFVWLALKLGQLQRTLARAPDELAASLEHKHRALLVDFNQALATSAERVGATQAQHADSVRAGVSQELQQTRESIQILQLAQSRDLAANREAMTQRLAEVAGAMQTRQDAMRTETLTQLHETLAAQGRAQNESAQSMIRSLTEQLVTQVDALAKGVETRLGEISGKVSERLDEGFKRTNDTFASVMARLATIDEAQKKIDGLTMNVVSLQELLGDKRSRGAFGEVQLEAIVRNSLPPGAYEMQATLSNQCRVDCLLRLPEPTGAVAVDSKFPLENYRASFALDQPESERQAALRRFKTDMKKHVDAIADKYIIANETSDGAVMFIPAEAVFAEIHAHHPDLVDYAQKRRVWVTSPTTLMAILNTARAVIKDFETRRQVHVIKDALSKLARDFERFDHRMQQLANHIRQANDDVQQVHVSSQKITHRFRHIEQVEIDRALVGEPGLTEEAPPAALVVPLTVVEASG